MLVASVSLPLAVSVFVFLFASLSVTLLNILFLSKARQADVDDVREQFSLSSGFAGGPRPPMQWV